MQAERCPDCERPLATQGQYDTHVEGCECEECRSVCWREWWGNKCQDEPHDWRAEALRLRARVKELEDRDAS